MGIWAIALSLATMNAGAEPPPAVDTSTTAQMRNHWTQATAARDSVIHGDLAGARLMGASLSERQAPDTIPRKSRPLYAKMQVAALALSEATELQQAGAAVGALGLTCGECHSFTGGGPLHVALPDPPPMSGPLPSDMALHQYSVDMLWLGLVADYPAAWKRGAEALANSTFDHNQPGRLGSVDLRAMEHITHLVPALANADEPADIAERFGQTITACAMCHGEVQDLGIKAEPPIEKTP